MSFQFHSEGRGENVERPTPNAQSRITERVDSGSEFEIGCWTLGVRRFLPPAFLPLRAATPSVYVPNLMRLFLRRAGLILATGSLVFFLSCERHTVGELPNEQARETKAPAKEHDSQSDQPTSTTNTSHTSQTAAPRNSPANFFPDKPKP